MEPPPLNNPPLSTPKFWNPPPLWGFLGSRNPPLLEGGGGNYGKSWIHTKLSRLTSRKFEIKRKPVSKLYTKLYKLNLFRMVELNENKNKNKMKRSAFYNMFYLFLISGSGPDTSYYSDGYSSTSLPVAG